MTIESVLKSHRTRASSLERSIVRIGLETYRSYELIGGDRRGGAHGRRLATEGAAARGRRHGVFMLVLFFFPSKNMGQASTARRPTRTDGLSPASQKPKTSLATSRRVSLVLGRDSSLSRGPIGTLDGVVRSHVTSTSAAHPSSGLQRRGLHHFSKSNGILTIQAAAARRGGGVAATFREVIYTCVEF